MDFKASMDSGHKFKERLHYERKSLFSRRTYEDILHISVGYLPAYKLLSRNYLRFLITLLTKPRTKYMPTIQLLLNTLDKLYPIPAIAPFSFFFFLYFTFLLLSDCVVHCLRHFFLKKQPKSLLLS